MTKRGLPVILAGISILTVAGIISGARKGNAGSEVRASTAVATVAAAMPLAQLPTPQPPPLIPAPSGVEVSSADSARMLAKLANEIAAAINLPAEVKVAHVGVLVRSLSTNKQIYALNPDKPLTPASTTKVVTAFTALSELGADFKIRTMLAAIDKPKDGTIAGDLYVKGYGDPFLSSAEIDALADQLIASGIKQIDGNIVGDGTYFDDKYDRTEYSGDEDEVENIPPISALSVESNRFSVVVTAPQTPGQPVTVQTFPHSAGFDLVNHGVSTGRPRSTAPARRRGRRRADLLDAPAGRSIYRTASYMPGTGSNGGELLAYAESPTRRKSTVKPKAAPAKPVARKKSAAKAAPQPKGKGAKKGRRAAVAPAATAAAAPASTAGSLRVSIAGARDQRQVIQVSGGLSAGRSMSYRYEMKNPPLVVAGIVYNRLRAHGIAIKGRAVSGVTPQRFKLLVQQERPLTQVLSQMLKHSDNYLAEFVFKMIGASAGGHEETAKHSVEKIARRMSISQIPFGLCVINDGSGLSRANCLSASALTGILTATYRDQKVFPAFYSAMSIAGIDGTLRRRMKGTCAEGNVHGKTGTLRNVSALTGYATTKDGEVIAFAMLMNGGNHGAYKAVQDKVAERLASFTYGDPTSAVTAR